MFCLDTVSFYATFTMELASQGYLICDRVLLNLVYLVCMAVNPLTTLLFG